MLAPDIDPVMFSLGPLQVRWYGVMYVIGFVLGGKILTKLCEMKFLTFPKEKVDSLITHMLIGMFIGARLVYVFIYNWDYYQDHLTELFHVWKGGLSFHGALIGLIAAMYVFGKKHKTHFVIISDSVALAGAQGLFWGRMGNFINGELYGRVTDSPIGMVFKNGGPFPRHPSQLYEAFFEGIVLMLLLWFIKSKTKIYGVVGTWFLIGYAMMRFGVEFFREADSQLGYYFGNAITMGQILCLVMAACGVFYYYFYIRKLQLKIEA